MIFFAEREKYQEKKSRPHVRKRQLWGLRSQLPHHPAPHFKKEREACCAENQHPAFHGRHPPGKHETLSSKTEKSAKIPGPRAHRVTYIEKRWHSREQCAAAFSQRVRGPWDERRRHVTKGGVGEGHGQQCNVTYRKPHTFCLTLFYLILPDHFVQRSIKLLFLLFFLKNERSMQATSSDSALVWKNRSLWRWFHRRWCCPRLRGVFSSAECFPDIPPIETYINETKVGKLWRSFLQTKERLKPLQATFDPSCPRLSSLRTFGENEWVLIAADRGKDSLPEWVRTWPCCLPYRTRQASSCPNFDRSLRWFVVLLALLSHFLVAGATRNCRYSSPAQR